MGKKSVGNIDLAIGRKIRQLRIEHGLTMQEFAGRIGITQQQAHKYERGLNRVAVSRLLMMAEALNTPISYFFSEMPAATEEHAVRHKKNMELVKYYQAIPSIKHQEAVSMLVRMLSGL